MLDDLNQEERLNLTKFVCSFAWADLEIAPEEREFVGRLVRRLELAPDEREQVDRWLSVPPSPEEVDPTAIPLSHRRTFIDCIEGIIAADGEVTSEEIESLDLLRRLLD